jgi:RND family efflux transporter MFP subunit
LAAAQNSQTVLVAQEQLNRDMISLNNAQNTMNVSLEQSQQQLKAAQLALNNALNGQDTTLEVSRAQLAYQEQTMQNSQSTEAVKVSLAQLEQAQNRLKTLEQQLADTTVLAPVDGVVTVINTPVGQNATGQGNLMTIASLNPLQALVNVSESNIGKLKVGQRMKVTVPTIGKSYDGVINAIRPTLDSVTKSYGVEIRVSDPKQELLPGMFASSSLTNEGRKAIMVPADAVISQPSGNAVFIVKDGRASRVSVKVGTLTSAMIEITSGLKEGDELIVKGQELLSDKAVVQVVEPGQNQAKPNQNQNQAKPNQNQNQAKPNQNQQNQNQQNRQPANAPAQTTPPAQGTAPAQTTTPANGAGNAQGAGAGQ